MKLRCILKSIYSDDINSQFQNETETVRVSEISTDVYNLMSRSPLISSWNPLNQLGPRVLVSKETLVPRRSESETLNFVIKRVVIAFFSFLVGEMQRMLLLFLFFSSTVKRLSG